MTCARCNRDNKIKARNLCNNCYRVVTKSGDIRFYPPIAFKRHKGICKKCKRRNKINKEGLCKACHDASTHISVYAAGHRETVYLQKMTDEEKTMFLSLYKQIRSDMFDDIIKNPRKWLDKK